MASSAAVDAATIVLGFIDMCPAKLKTRGCRNALVSDASCKAMCVRGHWRAAGERTANTMPMTEAFRNRRDDLTPELRRLG